MRNKSERNVSEDWWKAKIGVKRRLLESEDWCKTNVEVQKERSFGG